MEEVVMKSGNGKIGAMIRKILAL
jgi:hypothetical protein